MKKLVIAALAGFASVSIFAVAGQATAQSGAIQVAQAEPDFDATYAFGQDVYEERCIGCHGAEGQGGMGPMLAGNELVASARNVISMVLTGFEDHGMPAYAAILDNEEIAALTTYVRNSWGNDFGLTSPDRVDAYR